MTRFYCGDVSKPWWWTPPVGQTLRDAGVPMLESGLHGEPESKGNCIVLTGTLICLGLNGGSSDVELLIGSGEFVSEFLL